MSKLPLSNVVRVSILQALRGLANVNTSALAIITDEEPIPGDYGTAGFYLEPTGVANDYGSASKVFALANTIFSQSPNILTGGGFLTIIPRLQSAPASPATLLSSGPVNLLALAATDYELNAAVDGGPAADLTIGELDLTSLATAQASLNSAEVTAAGLQFVLTGELSSAQVTLRTIATGEAAEIVIGAPSTGTNIAAPLNLAGSAIGTAAGLESISDCILRTAGAVDYFGIVYTGILTGAEILATAKIVQAIDKIQFVGSNLTAAIAGVFTTVKNSGFTATRCLLYTKSAADAATFAAGYASRGLSVNYSGSGTASTMHLKEVIGLPGDSGITQTILTNAKNAGVDVYGDFGVPKVLTSGENQYFDQTYSRLAFKVRLQIAGFNFLASTTTKIPQTEQGLASLKDTYRQVCDEFVAAGVFAPGAWKGSTTFGNPEDHIRNIGDFGYYIYSLPIAQQSQVDRNARVAPLIQIAAKDAGAIHSSDVVALIEA
jgi:hypothetical protein